MTNTEKTSENDAVYEAAFHLLPTLSEAEVETAVGEICGAVEEAGGQIISQENPARMSLAYQMELRQGNKRVFYSESFFGWVKFVGSGDVASVVAESLGERRDILRRMVVASDRQDFFYHDTQEEQEDDENSEATSEEGEATVEGATEETATEAENVVVK